MTEIENEARSEGFDLIIGVDEVGVGPLAGPVVACAVALKSYSFQSTIRDSKKISERQREKAFLEIYEKAYVGVGVISEAVIDTVNILQARYLAMNRAVDQLIGRLPEEEISQAHFSKRVCLLIDGDRFKTDSPYKYKMIKQGDAKVLSIACASIIAKVTRDRILKAYDRVFPEYGFVKHKGYPTKAHKLAIKQFGPSIIHRMSFNHQ